MLFNVLVSLIAVNVKSLDITNPWILLVGIPFAVAGGTYGANQLKSIGQPVPNTVTETRTTTTTPTPEDPKPPTI